MTKQDESVPNTEDDARVASWLESLLDGTVVGFTRQPRWRPMWFVDVDRGGNLERIVVRGERTDTPLIFPLEHEMRFQRLLDEHGIPVPHVHGWSDDPRVYAMESVPGKPDFAGTPADQRATAVDEYVQALARMHQLPIDEFVKAGITRSKSPADAVHVGARQFENIYRSTKVRAQPLAEFVLGWLRRHPPPESNREAPIVWDSGQFHHQNRHLTSFVDVELGHLGDPIMDLAGWRMRDAVIPFGDFDKIYDRYADLTRRAVDMEAIQYHHLFFTLTNQLLFERPIA